MSQEDHPQRRKTDFEHESKKLSMWGDIVVLVGASLFAIIFFSFGLYHLVWQQTPWLIKMIEDHFNAIVITPLSMIGSTAIVLLLRYTDGDIEVKLPFGIEFKGAAGPIIFWVIVFTAIEASILAKW